MTPVTTVAAPVVIAPDVPKVSSAVVDVQTAPPPETIVISEAAGLASSRMPPPSAAHKLKGPATSTRVLPPFASSSPPTRFSEAIRELQSARKVSFLTELLTAFSPRVTSRLNSQSTRDSLT